MFKDHKLFIKVSQVFELHYTFNAFFELKNAVWYVLLNESLDLLPGPFILLDAIGIFLHTLSDDVDEMTNHLTNFYDATRRFF